MSHDPLYLSFHTNDSVYWQEKAKLLLRQLGNAVAALGFEIDYKAGRNDSDFYLAASRGEDLMAIVLAITNYSPSRWYVLIERPPGCRVLSEDSEIRQEMFTAIKSTLSDDASVSEVKWHSDHTTLPKLGEH
jgi:hypothetical protein